MKSALLHNRSRLAVFGLTALVVFFGFLIMSVNAQGGQPPNECEPGEISEDCSPPTLQSFEFIFVRVLFYFWGIGGLIWLAYFINIARLYFTADPGKIQEARNKFVMWLAGIFLFYLSIPIVQNIMRLMISDDVVNTNYCYEQFRQTPAFTFFFPDVCTDTT